MVGIPPWLCCMAVFLINRAFRKGCGKTRDDLLRAGFMIRWLSDWRLIISTRFMMPGVSSGRWGGEEKMSIALLTLPFQRLVEVTFLEWENPPFTSIRNTYNLSALPPENIYKSVKETRQADVFEGEKGTWWHDLINEFSLCDIFSVFVSKMLWHK